VFTQGQTGSSSLHVDAGALSIKGSALKEADNNRVKCQHVFSLREESLRNVKCRGLAVVFATRQVSLFNMSRFIM
jgi:hypothetical protein